MKYPKELKNLLRRLSRKRKRKLSTDKLLKLLDELGYYIVILGKNIKSYVPNYFDRNLKKITVSIEEGDLVFRGVSRIYLTTIDHPELETHLAFGCIPLILGCRHQTKYFEIMCYDYFKKGYFKKTLTAIAIVDRNWFNEIHRDK